MDYVNEQNASVATQYKTRNSTQTINGYEFQDVSDLTEDINYTDALFVPPLKIRSQLHRLIKYHSKDNFDKKHIKLVNSLSRLKANKTK